MYILIISVIYITYYVSFHYFLFSVSSVLQLLVHQLHAWEYQVLGGRPHELWGYSNELPHRQRDGKTANKGGATEEIQVPGMHKYGDALCRSHSHGGEVGMHQFLYWHIPDHASEDSGVPSGPRSLQGQFPRRAQEVQWHREPLVTFFTVEMCHLIVSFSHTSTKTIVLFLKKTDVSIEEIMFSIFRSCLKFVLHSDMVWLFVVHKLT